MPGSDSALIGLAQLPNIIRCHLRGISVEPQQALALHARAVAQTSSRPVPFSSANKASVTDRELFFGVDDEASVDANRLLGQQAPPSRLAKLGPDEIEQVEHCDRVRRDDNVANVAGYSATGHVTSDSFREPFQ